MRFSQKEVVPLYTKIYDMCEMTIENVLSAYDVIGKKFRLSDIIWELGKLCDAEKRRQEFQYEATAFNLQPNATDSPWGFYFGPHITGVDTNGKSICYPSLTDVTPDAVLYWESRYKSVSNAILKMRYAALVWDFKPKIVHENYAPDLYQIYVDSMLEVCDNDYAEHPVITTTIYDRLFSIAKGQPADLAKVKQSMTSFEKKFATDDATRYWACQFVIMLENKKWFTQSEINTLVQAHEERLKRLNYTEDLAKSNVWTIEQQCKLLSDYYKSHQKNDEIKRILNIEEKAHRLNFQTIAPIQKLGILEQLHKKYQYYGLGDESKRLLSEIQNAGKASKSSMEATSIEFSIPQEVYDQAEEMFGKKASSDAVRWQNFAIYFIPSETYEKQSLKELVDKYPLRYMVATQMMDANGRPMSVVGDYNSDPEGSLVLHITEKMNFSAYFLGIAIHKMIDVGLMGPERIMSEIIEPCILFDESNYDIIRQGLDFFFEGKYILACHIIVPQIENAIRNLIEKSGISVIKPQHKRNGFQLLTLDELLRTKAIEDAFTSDGALYLRLVLTDQRSLNIRNLLCHGIVPPQYFESGAAARLLHVLIMLGMVKETS